MQHKAQIRERRSYKGFSLIELLIVVAIILIIAAIAIPNLLRARISANEASAEGSVRSIVTAEFNYNVSYPSLGYTDLVSLGGPPNCVPSSATACIIDDVLSAGVKSGYSFTATGSNPVGGANTAYLITSVPANLNVTGVKAFCAAEDNVVRFKDPSAGPPDHATCLSTFPIAQ